jgi:pSer/pThr/pTyr-binding forkhead associated (FHA) protein
MSFIIQSDTEEHPLSVGINMVGRRKGNDIRLADAYVSRQHLSIDLLTDGTVTLLDLGSKNGLFVKGAKVPNAVLRCGEKFIIGTSVLRFQEKP